jgi:hypothetical protein
MIIDTRTGDLHIGDIIVSATAAHDEVFRLAPDSKAGAAQNGFRWIHLPAVIIDKKYFHFSLCFYHERLYCATFIFRDEDKTPAWDDWTEEEELRLQKRFDRWLDAAIGKAREFSWGAVSARYDPKGQTSSISIFYINEYLDRLFGKNLASSRRRH